MDAWVLVGISVALTVIVCAIVVRFGSTISPTEDEQEESEYWESFDKAGEPLELNHGEDN